MNKRWMLVLAAVAWLGAGCVSSGPRGIRQAHYRPNENRTIRSAAREVATVTKPAAPASLAATKPAPTPESSDDSRVLQIGDRLIVSLRAIPNPDDMKSVIDENGTINFPYIGAIAVAGKSAAEAQRMIERAYIDGGIYKYITVIIVPPETEFAVLGEVLRPGNYPLSRNMTLTQCLARGGRFTEFADRTAIKLIRGKETIEVNFKKIQSGKAEDPVVKPGDVIQVPRSWM